MLIMPLMIQNIENDDDRKFMEQLYHEYVRRMYSVAWKYGATQDNADDIVSESVNSLIENINKLSTKDKQKLHAYIFSVVKNKTLDFGRKARLEQGLMRHGFSADIDNLAGSDTVEELVLRREKIEKLNSIILGLPPVVRDILRMKCQENMSVHEIAEQTGLPENEIWNCLRKARYVIRKNI